jgi:hypothetical protein
MMPAKKKTHIYFVKRWASNYSFFNKKDQFVDFWRGRLSNHIDEHSVGESVRFIGWLLDAGMNGWSQCRLQVWQIVSVRQLANGAGRVELCPLALRVYIWESAASERRRTVRSGTAMPHLPARVVVIVHHHYWASRRHGWQLRCAKVARREVGTSVGPFQLSWSWWVRVEDHPRFVNVWNSIKSCFCQLLIINRLYFGYCPTTPRSQI